MIMIYDTFIFFNELDLLEIRLRELADQVDKFVLVENTEDHRGRPKRRFFDENRNRFDQWKDKIDVVNLDGYGLKGDDVKTNMRREHLSRSALNSYPYEDGSIIIHEDADEICRASSIRDLEGREGSHRLEMRWYHYFLNCQSGTTNRSVIGPVDDFRKYGFDHMRWGTDALPVAKDAGWHWSYFGDASELRAKIESAVEGHASFWTRAVDTSVLQGRIDKGQLYDGNKQFQFVPIDESYPRWVRDNVAALAGKNFIKL